MKKVLFVATIHKHFRAFHLPYMRWFKEQGWSVDAAGGGDDVELPGVDNKFYIDIERTPFSLHNIKAYRQLKDLIDKGNYDLVYCHTAMGAVLARLAARKMRSEGNTKVIYVAHGFHFFKGSPKLYWLIYYPIEKFLSRYTDAIVTINTEDYKLVKEHGFRNLYTYQIDGIGVDTDRFFVASPEQKTVLRAEIGLSDSDFILIYVAEHIERKNHAFILEAMPQLMARIPQVKVLFAGRGRLLDVNSEHAKRLGVDKNVEFLGFRTDIDKLLALSDVGVSASRQEGLGLNLIEEMSAGLPVVATQDRGHREIVVNGKNGYLFEQGDVADFCNRIHELYCDYDLRKKMGECAKDSVRKFELHKAVENMAKIFNEICN